MVSKTLTTRVVALSLGLALLGAAFPFLAFAQPNGDRANAEDFCANIDDHEEAALNKLNERKAGSDRSGEVESKKAERLAQLDAHRAERDADREAKYDELRDRATTDAQSAAVEDFVSTAESLVADRKAAVDAAIEAFEAAVSDLLGERDTAITDYSSDIEEDIMSIFDDAEEACNGGSDNEVAKQVREDMKAMRESIKADRDQYSFKDELEAARADRKAATDAAKADFQAGYETAKAELKAAFETS